MTVKSIQRNIVISMLALLVSGCGNVRDQGRSAVQLFIEDLEGIPGDASSQKGETILSDVQTTITSPDPCSSEKPCATWINDTGEVTFAAILKDQGQAGLTAEPSALNAVTINRYHVEYVRSDGRNTQGVDVPYAFDGAFTVTVNAGETVQATFDLVRNNAKKEAPLVSLICAADPNNPALPICPPMISTIAKITFYGTDLTGHAVTVTGTIGVTFGDVTRAS
ncbi:MAG TPA: hypothetical protein VL173_14755 [Vicinamibacterales bacterium]|nr:hypothetical protein [Vicinamibacterales bacterium]